MHSVDQSAQRLSRRTSPEPTIRARINPTTHKLGPVAIGAGSGAIVVFLLFLAASPWLPDLMTRERNDLSDTSTASSAATTPPREQPDEGPRLASNPLIPIVIRRSTPADAPVSDLPPESEISPSPGTVPESADSATDQRQLDLHDTEDAKRVQQRLIDLGFLFGAADGRWGSRSRRALQDFKAANGIGDNDTWDEVAQERLLAAPDANATATSDVAFVGGWAVDAAACRTSTITITAQRAADGFGAACEFHSTQRESLNVWRLRALCADNRERWNANIRFSLSGAKLTWSSEKGTTTYVRCPT
jgi:putative peptidoglycan binding protein